MRRVIVTVVVFLLLGAIVNVAVAWAAAIAAEWPAIWTGSSDSGAARLQKFVDKFDIGCCDEPSWAISSSSPAQDCLWIFDWQLEVIDLGEWRRIEFENPFFNVYIRREELQFWNDSVISVRSGFPCRAMRGLVHESARIGGGSRTLLQSDAVIDPPNTDPALFSAIIVTQPERLGGQYRFLPLKPIWPGFLINSLFYATILCPLFAVPLTFRRTIRHRRGQCRACGYPVGVSPNCTECGAAVDPQTTASR